MIRLGIGVYGVCLNCGEFLDIELVLDDNLKTENKCKCGGDDEILFIITPAYRQEVTERILNCKNKKERLVELGNLVIENKIKPMYIELKNYGLVRDDFQKLIDVLVEIGEGKLAMAIKLAR